jgi:hypothetical protein
VRRRDKAMKVRSGLRGVGERGREGARRYIHSWRLNSYNCVNPKGLKWAWLGSAKWKALYNSSSRSPSLPLPLPLPLSLSLSLSLLARVWLARHTHRPSLPQPKQAFGTLANVSRGSRRSEIQGDFFRSARTAISHCLATRG